MRAGFNPTFTNGNGSLPLVPASANLLTDDNIRTNSFFLQFTNSFLYGMNGSSVAQQTATYRRLLADALPSLSFAMGRNDLSGFGAGTYDMSIHKNGWPQIRQDNEALKDLWLHSDIKNVAYKFTYAVFDDIVINGALK